LQVWKHLRKSEQPSLCDAITYVAKPITFVLAVGAFFWSVYADLSQPRYYYPFAFITLILHSFSDLLAQRYSGGARSFYTVPTSWQCSISTALTRHGN